uniref:DALR anticodon binding domain-containing protein n=1 Tax=Felis catus TaxID=9685 RepID=A0ABI8ASZ4_FELCA
MGPTGVILPCGSNPDLDRSQGRPPPTFLLFGGPGGEDRTLGLRWTRRFRNLGQAGQTGHAEGELGPKVESGYHGSLWRTCQLRGRHRIRALACRCSRKFGLPGFCFRFCCFLPVAMATGRLGVEETLGALNTALGPGDPVWFKETRARHLRARDFLAPRPALQARFGDGQQLRVDWPAASERAATEALRNRALAELSPAQERGALPRGVLGTVCLKELVQERGRAAGYDPNLDKCLVTEDLLSVLAELQEAARCWPGDSPPSLAAVPDANADRCMVVHVVSCEEEFQQQKVDLLWRKLDDQAPLTQKHLVCGPVKVAGAPGTLTAPEYYELRHAQVCKASAAKHGRDLAQDPAWTEVFSVLSVATIKFEMLSTAPHGQLLLALADSSISTKGTKSGTFVMYNCARLATLFEGYRHSMERGLYPTFPPVSSLDFSLLQDEGEWLLLFNGILPFPDLLSQTAALACTAPGLHTTARTETMCKFLVQLSMDFSSYYNRIHILGAPRPHLFGQMFARLQLLRAVREVLHTGLATLGLPPLDHI